MFVGAADGAGEGFGEPVGAAVGLVGLTVGGKVGDKVAAEGDSLGLGEGAPVGNEFCLASTSFVCCVS